MGAYYYDNSVDTDAGYIGQRPSSGMEGLFGGGHHHHRPAHGNFNQGWMGDQYSYPIMLENYMPVAIDWRSVCADPLQAADYQHQCIEYAAQMPALSGYLGAAATNPKEINIITIVAV